MIFLNKYSKNIFLFFILLPIAFKTAVSDTILTNSNEDIVCVVVDQTDEILTVITKNGKRSFEQTEIKNIQIADKKDNLLLLAQFSVDNNDYIKAYYLYEEVLTMDVNSKMAIEGLTLMENHLKNDNSDYGWVQNYERLYEKVSSEKSEKNILKDNSEITEELIENFGLILISRDDRIKVSEVINNSVGYEAGFSINDYIISVDDLPVEYLGLYDTIIELNKKKSDNINVKIERSLRVWNKGEDDTVVESLSFSDYSLEKINGVFVFTRIVENTPIFDAGVHVGDSLLQIKGVKLSKNTDTKKLSHLIRNIGSGFIDLVIQKNLFMNK